MRGCCQQTFYLVVKSFKWWRAQVISWRWDIHNLRCRHSNENRRWHITSRMHNILDHLDFLSSIFNKRFCLNFNIMGKFISKEYLSCLVSDVWDFFVFDLGCFELGYFHIVGVYDSWFLFDRVVKALNLLLLWLTQDFELVNLIFSFLKHFLHHV